MELLFGQGKSCRALDAIAGVGSVPGCIGLNKLGIAAEVFLHKVSGWFTDSVRSWQFSRSATVLAWFCTSLLRIGERKAALLDGQ
jgi:hypothetical protein